MADLSDRIAEVLHDKLDDRDVITVRDPVVRTRIHPGWTGPIAWELAEAVVAALQSVALVANVQAAIMASMNAVGSLLLGSGFVSVTSSPITDDEVAQILTEVGVLGEEPGL